MALGAIAFGALLPPIDIFSQQRTPVIFPSEIALREVFEERAREKVDRAA
jgi:hypothetical protein